MLRILLILLIISSIGLTASAQSESDLKEYFEGKQVIFRIDMPATSEGVNIYPERSQSLNYNQYHKRLRNHGASIHRGELAAITNVTIKNKHIEVGFAKAEGGGSRFTIHFARVESWMLTPVTLIDALNRYVEFNDDDKNSARLQPSSEYATGYVRQGVVHLGPRSTYLKEGLKTQEVLKLLGEPSAISERSEDGRVVSIYEFQRGEGRILIAEFVGDALIGSRIETRS
jgi:hypothetical protein